MYALGSLIKSELIDNFEQTKELLKEIEYINANLGVRENVSVASGVGTSSTNTVDFSTQLATAQASANGITTSNIISNNGLSTTNTNGGVVMNNYNNITGNNFGYDVSEVIRQTLDENMTQIKDYIYELYNG